MRVLLSTYGGRGGVEPLAGLTVRLRELGAEVRVCDIARVAIEAIRERATAVARHDPHRWDDRGRDAAARRDQPGKVASIRVNHTVLVPAPMVASDLRSELMP